MRRVAEETGVSANDLDSLIEILQSWIDQDKKHTALKALQGMIWVDGYRSAALSMRRSMPMRCAAAGWHAQAFPCMSTAQDRYRHRSCSSCSTEHGDLSPLFSDYFDTEIGGKRSAKVMRPIAAAIGQAPADISIPVRYRGELDAAREAGWQTVLIDRLERLPDCRDSAMNATVTAE